MGNYADSVLLLLCWVSEQYLKMLWEGFRLLIELQGEASLIKKAMRSYEDSTDSAGFKSTSLLGLFRAELPCSPCACMGNTASSHSQRHAC